LRRQTRLCVTGPLSSLPIANFPLYTQYRTRHNAKLDLAGFLCTTFTLPIVPTPSVPLPDDSISTPFLPRLPHVTSLTTPSSSRPIYYLPRRLLPSQEDRIEDQIDAVKQAMRKDRDAWEDVKKEKLARLEEVKRKREERQGEVERKEREERQRRRREEEDKEDRERERRERTREASAMAVDHDEGAREKSQRASLPPPRRSPSPAAATASEATSKPADIGEEQDVAMKEDSAVEEKKADEAPAELSSVSALNVPAEDELEY
jgi:hypothetical protein